MADFVPSIPYEAMHTHMDAERGDDSTRKNKNDLRYGFFLSSFLKMSLVYLEILIANGAQMGLFLSVLGSGEVQSLLLSNDLCSF